MKYFTFPKQTVSTFIMHWYTRLFLAALIGVSFVSWFISYRLGLSTAYNDAMAHLNISRSIIDNLYPGFAQLGGVWLPLNHILSLGLIWNDWAWHSGFAGSIVSMLAYIASAVTIYFFITLLTKRALAGIVGAGVFALNANMLYLQTTALTEPLYMLFFTLSAYFFAHWIIKKQDTSLLLLGCAGFLQVLTRYDGWFVVVFEGLLVAYFLLITKRLRLSEAIGKLLIFAFPILFGITLWILWNLLIFKDPLFFALGPYSAHAQQMNIENAAGLLTKHSVWYSLLAYTYAMADNIGWYVLGSTGAAVLYVIFKKFKGISMSEKILIILFLLTPVIFNILALFLGFSILNIPELHWKPSGDPEGQWFNVRYGILVLPYAAVLLGVFASWKKFAGIIVLELIILQFVLMVPHNIITLTDGVQGSSSFKNKDIARKLQTVVHPDDTVLLSTSFFSPVAFQSGMSLRQIIHEGTGSLWSSTLQSPENYAQWIVVANYNVGDPVYTALVEKERGRFLKQYSLVFKGKHANLYSLKNKTISYHSLLTAPNEP